MPCWYWKLYFESKYLLSPCDMHTVLFICHSQLLVIGGLMMNFKVKQHLPSNQSCADYIWSSARAIKTHDSWKGMRQTFNRIKVPIKLHIITKNFIWNYNVISINLRQLGNWSKHIYDSDTSWYQPFTGLMTIKAVSTCF